MASDPKRSFEAIGVDSRQVRFGGMQTNSKDGVVAGSFKRRFWGWPSWWLAVLAALLLLTLEPRVIAAKPALGLPLAGVYVLVVFVALAALIAGIRRARSRARAIVWGALASIGQIALFLSIVIVIGIKEQPPRPEQSRGISLIAHQSSQPNVSFAEYRCEAHKKGSPSRTVTTAWDKDILVVKAPVCLNCAATVEDVTAKVEGNSVLLTVISPRPEHPTACDCERSVHVRISSLPKREYTIRGVPPVDVCI
jgi:uncharacterized membrane protein YhaH (DUF805 family)